MNIAVVFAGGVGKRMNSNGIPKQFLKIDGVPIIIHTLLVFEECKEVDGIVVACVSEYIGYLRELVNQYKITKVLSIVEGGETNQLSSYNGIVAASQMANEEEDNIVLMHDGVRPIIDDMLIKQNIAAVKKYKSAISCVPTKETTVIIDKQEKNIINITDRENTYIARAPQSFRLKDILEAHEKAREVGEKNMIDACSLMTKFSSLSNFHIVECSSDNIKITTPDDFYIAEALIRSKKAKQILGV